MSLTETSVQQRGALQTPAAVGYLFPAVSAPKVKIDGDIVGSECRLHWSPNLSYLARSRGVHFQEIVLPFRR